MSSAPTQPPQKQVAAIPDDEFEDFPHEGMRHHDNREINFGLTYNMTDKGSLDWSNEESSLGVKKEWEDSWDDDDVQDDFSKQLKAELAKQDSDTAMKQ